MGSVREPGLGEWQVRVAVGSKEVDLTPMVRICDRVRPRSGAGLEVNWSNSSGVSSMLSLFPGLSLSLLAGTANANGQQGIAA